MTAQLRLGVDGAGLAGMEVSQVVALRGPGLFPGPALAGPRLRTQDPAAPQEGHHAPDVHRAIHRHRRRRPGRRRRPATPRAPVPAGPAGHDHQARHPSPGDPAAAVTGDPPQTNPGHTRNRMAQDAYRHTDHRHPAGPDRRPLPGPVLLRGRSPQTPRPPARSPPRSAAPSGSSASAAVPAGWQRNSATTPTSAAGIVTVRHGAQQLASLEIPESARRKPPYEHHQLLQAHQALRAGPGRR